MIAKKVGFASTENVGQESVGPVDVCGCDVDGTIIRGPFKYSWQLVWKYLGYDDALRRELFRNYKLGQLSYSAWCAECLAYFQARNLRESDFVTICAELRPTRNLVTGIGMLRRAGVSVGVISGGIDSVLKTVIPDWQDLFNFVYINKFVYNSSGSLVGIKPTSFDFDRKLYALQIETKKRGLSLSAAAFVGEGPNDAYVMKELSIGHRGLSIAYPANDLEVELNALIEVDVDDFTKVAESILVHRARRHN
jgi:phosphoserine phosphatase